MTSSPEPADTPAGLRSVASSGELVMIDTMLIHAALTAYAAGDAFGVAYEFLDHPKPVDPQVLADLPDWPHGGVSDDTLLTLLTVGAISDDGPAASAAAFLADLRQALPELRGPWARRPAHAGAQEGGCPDGLQGTHGVPDQNELVEVEAVRDGDDVRGESVQVVAAGGEPGATVTAPIDSDDPVSLVRERDDLGVPHVGGQAPSMEEHHREPFGPPIAAMELDPVRCVRCCHVVPPRR